MAVLRIKVGASVDSSVDAVFPRIERAASRARSRVEKEFGSAVPAAMKKGTDKAQAAFDKLAAEVEGKGSKMMDPAIRSATEMGNASLARFNAIKRGFNDLANSAEKEMKRIAKAEAGGGGGAGIWGNKFASRMGYSAMRNFSPYVPTLGAGVRIAGDLARGAGINFNTGSLVQSYVQRQSMAVDIANSGYQPGAKGAAGKLQSSAAIDAESMAVGKKFAVDPEKALEGLKKFVEITGDLETGRNVLGDMAKLSNATGSSMEDVVTAAGEISAKLGDIPHKAETINAIMRQVAGQGKLGAVEMRDFAKQLASVAAIAPSFGGNVKTNIGEMAILLQEARQLGGAKSASQAATGVRAFASTFTKGARIKEFHALGINLEAKGGGLRAPEEVILEALKKTGGKGAFYEKLFTSEQSKTAVRGFQTIYRNAGGGQKGLDAVAAEFDRLRKATMSEADVEEANARKMETAAAKAQAFQNNIQEIADKVVTRLIPAFDEMAPKILKVAEAFGSVVEWFASHSLGADIAVLIGASITKAAIDTTLRTGVESMVRRALGGGGPAGGGAPVGGGMGGVGAVLNVAGAAYAGWQVGQIIADKIVGDIVNTQNKGVGSAIDSVNVANNGNEADIVRQIAQAQKDYESSKANIGHQTTGEAVLSSLAFLKEFTLGGDDATRARDDTVREQKRLAQLQLDALNMLVEKLDAIRAKGNGLNADQTGRNPVSFSRGH